ncbi:hypothetical protein D3C80_1470650 [compost metagenome]
MRIDRQRAGLRPQIRAHLQRFGGSPDRARDRAECQRALGAGNSCACRPPFGGCLPEGKAGRPYRYRRAHHAGAESVRCLVQYRTRLRPRWQPVRRAVRRRGRFPHWQPACPRAAHPGAHARVHELHDRGRRRDRGVCRRHPVHARLRHCPLRLPGCRCPYPVPLDPPPAGLPRPDSAVHVS